MYASACMYIDRFTPLNERPNYASQWNLYVNDDFFFLIYFPSFSREKRTEVVWDEHFQVRSPENDMCEQSYRHGATSMAGAMSIIPTMSTVDALVKCGHRLIGRTGL